MSNWFGGKPKTPELVTQPEKIEQVGPVEKDKIYSQLAKRRRATLLTAGQDLGQPNIGRTKLGAG